MSLVQDSILLMAALNIVFALIVYLHSKKSLREIFFIFSTFSVGLWSLAVFILISPDISLIFFKFGLISHFWAGNFIFLSFLWFAWFYKNTSPGRYIILPLLLSAGDIALLLSMVFSDFVFKSIMLADNLNTAVGINKIGYTTYCLYLFVVFLIIELILAKKYTSSSGAERKQLGYIIAGTSIAGLLGLTTNLFLPGIGIFSFFTLGPTLSTIFVALISYAILKHALFNLRIITTELFAIRLMMAVAGNAFTARNQGDALVAGFVFVLVLVFGILLIRSVYREVRQREEIERLAGDLAKANEELKKLDAAKSEFISLAGHQLRAPLTAIKGYSSMMLEGSFGKIEESAAEVLRRVMTSADQLVKMAADLLDLSRIEAGKFKYNFTPLHFSEVIRKALGELEGISKARGIALEFTDENKEKLRVNGDPDKIHEIVINLIDNALKYTKDGPITAKLEVVNSGGRKNLRFSVCDKGIGVPKEDLHKLFTKFARTEAAQKVRPEGMGLGLYFVKKITEDHGGRVWAESAGIGKGSTFFTELPVL